MRIFKGCSYALLVVHLFLDFQLFLMASWLAFDAEFVVLEVGEFLVESVVDGQADLLDEVAVRHGRSDLDIYDL